MNARLVLAMCIFLALPSAACAESGVYWIWTYEDWCVQPANPTCVNVISFSGSSWFIVGGNFCEAELLAGTPILTVDSARKVVDIMFLPPPADVLDCWMNYDPVNGLAGQFGPLEPGRWTFRVFAPYSSPFWGMLVAEVPFDVLPAEIAGDVTRDCRVDVLDLMAIRNKLGQDAITGDNLRADLNGDGKINVMDLILARNRMLHR